MVLRRSDAAWEAPGGERPVRNPTVNSIRPGRLVSLPFNGETRTVACCPRKLVALRGSVAKRRRERSGGWRRNGRKAKPMTQRDLRGSGRPTRTHAPPCRPAGVRASIVASKPGNAGGAKGRRKMDAGCRHRRNTHRRQCRERLHKAERSTAAGRGSNQRRGQSVC